MPKLKIKLESVLSPESFKATVTVRSKKEAGEFLNEVANKEYKVMEATYVPDKKSVKQ